MPSTLPSQNVIPGLVPSVSTAGAAPQLMPAQLAAPPGGSIPQRTLYSPPKPKIPDFTSDNEREFANMKLALDNLLEPYPELTQKNKYHVRLEHLNSISLNPYNLQDFAGWLQVKAQQQRLSIQLVQRYQHERLPGLAKEKPSAKLKGPSLVLYHDASPAETALSTRPKMPKQKKLLKVHCLFCNSKEHYITCCDNIKKAVSCRPAKVDF